MKEVINRILESEQKAEKLIVDARASAGSMLHEVEIYSQQLLENVKQQALEQSKKDLEAAKIKVENQYDDSLKRMGEKMMNLRQEKVFLINAAAEEALEWLLHPRN